MKSIANQSPSIESMALSKLPVEELADSMLASKWMVPSQGSSVLADSEQKSPPQIEIPQKNKQPTTPQVKLLDQSTPQKANSVTSDKLSTSQEQEINRALTCGDSAIVVATSSGSQGDASNFLGTSNVKKVRHSESSGESETSPKSGSRHRPRGFKSPPTSRVSLGSYSMPSLLSINENRDSVFLVNEIGTSFLELGNESTVSSLDNSWSRTTISSHGRGAPSYSSLPSLRSIEDNEDSELHEYEDNDRSFGDSSSTESVFNSFQKRSRMLPIMVDGHRPAFFGVKSLQEVPRLAAESMTKDIISPPPISQHLYSKNMEKRLHRWDSSAAVSQASLTCSPTRRPIRTEHLRPALLRANATSSMMASLKNDTSSVADSDSTIKVPVSPPATTRHDVALAAVNPDGRALPSVHSDNTVCDTSPTMVVRRPSLDEERSDACSSDDEYDLPLR